MLALMGIGHAIIAAAAVAAAIVIYISGKITREKMKQKLKEEGIGDILIREVNKCTNVISAEALYSDGVSDKKKFEFHGDSISDDICKKDVIYV